MTTQNAKPKRERKVRTAPTKGEVTAPVPDKDTTVSVVQATGVGSEGQEEGTAPKDKALCDLPTLGPAKILEHSPDPLLSYAQALRSALSHRNSTLTNLFHSHFAETQDAEQSLNLARRQCGLEV